MQFFRCAECGVAYQADGTPGLLCAGWAARRRQLLAEVDS